MEQPSFGGRLQLRTTGEIWIPLEETYLTEGTSYDWRYDLQSSEQAPSICFCELPLFPIRISQGFAYGQLTTPFYSGQVRIEVDGFKLGSYLYSDDRKMTQEQYDRMLHDILEEASLCFEYSNIEIGIDANQRIRELSLAQWSYVEASFSTLAVLIWSIVERPLRVLKATECVLRRDRVRMVDTRTMAWLEQNRGKCAEGTIPETVKTSVREDSYNTYENKMLKRWLMELRHLLKEYGSTLPGERSGRADAYADRVGYWLRAPMFKQVEPYQGVTQISQVFRKHPVYRPCYQWFDRLYKHGNERIGLTHRYPLRETYALYEIWCYMQLVKILREKGLLQDTSGLFRTSREGLFLHFAEHHESMVKLKHGMKLSYQRVFQHDSQRFYTYTQRMIPDIVIEAGERLYILDPKYRVAGNLGTALGEMHKYKDGILLEHNDQKAVENVVIVTPAHEEGLRFFKPEFHNRYQMGAISLIPGGDLTHLDQWLEQHLTSERGGEKLDS